jgi:hypothetical protein
MAYIYREASVLGVVLLYLRDKAKEWFTSLAIEVSTYRGTLLPPLDSVTLVNQRST